MTAAGFLLLIQQNLGMGGGTAVVPFDAVAPVHIMPPNAFGGKMPPNAFGGTFSPEE